MKSPEERKVEGEIQKRKQKRRHSTYTATEANAHKNITGNAPRNGAQDKHHPIKCNEGDKLNVMQQFKHSPERETAILAPETGN